MTILAEAYLRTAQSNGDSLANLAIRDLFMEAPFTIIELTDGRVGVALNPDHPDQRYGDGEMFCEGSPEAAVSNPPQRDWNRIAADLLKQNKTDPLLTRTLLGRQDQLRPFERSVLVAMVNALAGTSSLNGKTLHAKGFRVEDRPVPVAEISKANDILALIGFCPRTLLQALHDPNICRVFVTDSRWSCSSELRSHAESFLAQFGERISFLESSNDAPFPKRCTLAIIRSGAICEGNMETLLDGARKAGCREVIVQGHSAGPGFSGILFERGATLHMPTRIERNFLKEAKKFVNGSNHQRLPSANGERSFHEFVDLRLRSMAIREKRTSFGAFQRNLREGINQALESWGWRKAITRLKQAGRESLGSEDSLNKLGF